MRRSENSSKALEAKVWEEIKGIMVGEAKTIKIKVDNDVVASTIRRVGKDYKCKFKTQIGNDGNIYAMMTSPSFAAKKVRSKYRYASVISVVYHKIIDLKLGEVACVDVYAPIMDVFMAVMMLKLIYHPAEYITSANGDCESVIVTRVK